MPSFHNESSAHLSAESHKSHSATVGTSLSQPLHSEPPASGEDVGPSLPCPVELKFRVWVAGFSKNAYGVLFYPSLAMSGCGGITQLAPQQVRTYKASCSGFQSSAPHLIWRRGGKLESVLETWPKSSICSQYPSVIVWACCPSRLSTPSSTCYV